MSYLGKVELKSSEIRRVDVTGSTSATHTLTWTPASEQSLIITINGIKQQNNYSISGTTLTLDDALISTDAMEVIGILDIGEATVPPDDSITNAMVKSDAAIAKTKLASLDIVNADINASAAIAQSKLSLDITNSSINASAAIAQSKLANVPFYTSSATAPTSPTPVSGDIWYDTTNDVMKARCGAAWKDMSAVLTTDGGVITTYSDGGIDYKVHTFLSSGTFVITGTSVSVDAMIVGSGGGGGSDMQAGGAGGGGMVTMDAYTAIIGSHTVTIGAGGAVDTDGNNSSVFGETATPGGSGGDTADRGGTACNGGGSGSNASAGTNDGTIPSVTDATATGFGGFDGGATGASRPAGAGGAGCAENGESVAGTYGPGVSAGNGKQYNIDNNNYYWGGGGGGGSFWGDQGGGTSGTPPASGDGGLGGGGAGSCWEDASASGYVRGAPGASGKNTGPQPGYGSTGGAAGANTGGGGGNAALGGSGCVQIRFRTN
jgi:hypothetical protein